MKLFDVIPEFYQHFIHEKYNINVPEELSADCSDCVMLSENSESISSVNYFIPEIKCCSYYPFLKNYQIGAVFFDNDLLDGQKALTEVIANRVGVIPTGIKPPKKYLLLSGATSSFFGRSKAMICPYFSKSNGECSVWKYRSAVCQTWFCKHDHGKDGELFWHNVKSFLLYIEAVLSAYVLHIKNNKQIELPFYYNEQKKHVQPLSLEDLEGLVKDSAYEKIWENNIGDEIEFYKSCFRIIKDLSKEEFEKIAGVYFNILFEKIQDSSKTIFKFKQPKFMKRNPNLISEKIDDETYLVSLSGNNNTFTISKLIFDIIDLFDGKLSVKEVNKITEKQYDSVLDDSLIQALYHNRILIEP